MNQLDKNPRIKNLNHIITCTIWCNYKPPYFWDKDVKAKIQRLACEVEAFPYDPEVMIEYIHTRLSAEGLLSQE